jgi:osmotically-inducible protein OsmY
VNTTWKYRAAIFCAFIGVALCGVAAGDGIVGTYAASGSAAAAPAPNAYSIPDADLRDSVQFALHADPYFYDGHVEVSVNHGVVHLRGLVFSDWDLRDAMRIASKAAGDRRVINNLTIVEGGRR